MKLRLFSVAAIAAIASAVKLEGRSHGRSHGHNYLDAQGENELFNESQLGVPNHL